MTIRNVVARWAIYILPCFVLAGCGSESPDCIDMTPDDDYGCNDATVRTVCNGEVRTGAARDWALAIVDPVSKCLWGETRYANTIEDAIECAKLDYPGYEIVDADKACEFVILDENSCIAHIVLNISSSYALQCTRFQNDIDGEFTDYTDDVRETGSCRGGFNWTYIDRIQSACQ